MRWSGMNLPIWKPKLDLITRTSPIVPALMSSTSFAVCGCRRYMKASPAKVPALRAAWNTASASKAVSASGFSTSTCLPASAALIAHSAWLGCGVAI